MSSKIPASRLTAHAENIDPDRARELGRRFATHPAAPVAVLLGTAFPPLTPVSDVQLGALSGLELDGLRLPRRRGDFLRRFGSVPDDLDELGRRLGRWVWAERARIALRELLPYELGGAGIRATARELSDLAGACFALATECAARNVASRFGAPRRADGSPSKLVVLGMGKLGGHELNAGSDVDVVFFYDTDDGGSSTSLHDHWTRVVQQVVKVIDNPTNGGLVWRVDLRLRPEGSQGALVNSVAAADRYYETWGRLWERAALLRARAIAGDTELGELLSREVITPFVYRREVDPSIATALTELVQRSRVELSADPARDLKLGPGGIREAEFFIQSLQLIWGGREPSLRVTGSLSALTRLRSRGLVSDLEARQIAEAYLFLRTVEHRIQWMTGVQTHLLPEADAERQRLSRSLGYDAQAAFESVLARARETVSGLLRSLSPSVPRPPPRYHSFLVLLDQEHKDVISAAERTFGSAEVGEHLLALSRRPDGIFGTLTRERYPELADNVLHAIGASADPDQAAHYLRSFILRFLSPRPYVTVLGEDPIALKRLVTVLGASAFVGEALVSRPDLADHVLFASPGAHEPRDSVALEVGESVRNLPAAADVFERRDALVTALRRAKRRVTVEVAVADLAGTIGTREATRLLSDLADEELDRAVSFEMDGKEGLSVIAVGKLGGRDIGYGSDLDVLFVYDDGIDLGGMDPGSHFARIAQRVIRLISEPHPAGPGYELDTRLRPSGSHGMLVTSLSSFARYHGVTAGSLSPPASRPAVMSSGAAWERQALLRARACAGDMALGERVIEVAKVAAYERGAPPVEELHRLRLRMQNELAREHAGQYDLKTGQGGLLDIEFCSQWLQMRHGADPRVRTTDTGEALEALFSAGYLAQDDFQVLRDGYLFLRRLEQRIHVQHGKGSTRIGLGLGGLEQLARRMGLEERGASGKALLAQYEAVTRDVRAAYCQVLEIEEPR